MIWSRGRCRGLSNTLNKISPTQVAHDHRREDSGTYIDLVVHVKFILHTPYLPRDPYHDIHSPPPN